MIDKIFDFLYDPFGKKKQQDDKYINDLIKRLDAKSKQVDKALLNQDYDMADRIIASMKNK